MARFRKGCAIEIVQKRPIRKSVGCLTCKPIRKSVGCLTCKLTQREKLKTDD